MSDNEQDNDLVIENKFTSDESERNIGELLNIEDSTNNYSNSESKGLNAKELKNNILKLRENIKERLSGKEKNSKDISSNSLQILKEDSSVNDGEMIKDFFKINREKKNNNSLVQQETLVKQIDILNKEESLSWYIKISRWPVLFLVLFDVIAIYSRGNLLSLMRLPVEIFIFICLSYHVIYKKYQAPKIAGIAAAFVGFESGVIIAVFKLFWNREIWNIFNLSMEPIFLTVVAFIIGMIMGGVFYDEDRVRLDKNNI